MNIVKRVNGCLPFSGRCVVIINVDGFSLVQKCVLKFKGYKKFKHNCSSLF